MTKAATERIVKKVWSAKMQHDAGAKEASPLVDFVGKFIHDDLKAKGSELRDISEDGPLPAVSDACCCGGLQHRWQG